MYSKLQQDRDVLGRGRIVEILMLEETLKIDPGAFITAF